MPLKTDTVEEPSLNLTPMIDVVFLLIIFFMVGTQITQMERQYEVDLPTVSDARPLTAMPDEIAINVKTDGVITVNGKARTLEELQSDLVAAKENFAEQGVVIRGEKDLPYQDVMNVLSVVVQSGIKSYSLAYRLGSEGEG